MGKISDFNFSNQYPNDDIQKGLEEKYEGYKNMSQSQLNEELFKEVGRQKNSGTFDYEKLEKMVSSLQGMMPQENYENIKRILNSLK